MIVFTKAVPVLVSSSVTLISILLFVFTRVQSAVLVTVNPSVRLSVCHTLALCQKDSSYDDAVFTVDSPMTLVSSRLTSPQNSKANTGSEGAE